MKTDIDLAKVAETLIRLETRYDEKEKKDEANVQQFTKYVHILIAITLFAIIENALLHVIVALQ